MIPVPFKQTNVLKAMIVPFKDVKMQQPVPQNTFVIPVNPETYDQSYRVQSDTRVSPGRYHADIKFLKAESQDLRLNFILDGTGTIEGYFNPGNLPVLVQIARLKAAVYDIESEAHRPYFLKVLWGSLVFCGVLSSMDINYTLFNPVGIPIRAKVSLTLKQHEDAKKGSLLSRLASPDVTHIRAVKAGDRLDQITNDVYNDPNLVLQVAKANGLTSFRNVKAGIEITLPPVDNATT